jgi:hypothetical protein
MARRIGRPDNLLDQAIYNEPVERHAKVAELADAPDLGTVQRDAPKRTKIHKTFSFNEVYLQLMHYRATVSTHNQHQRDTKADTDVFSTSVSGCIARAKATSA